MKLIRCKNKEEVGQVCSKYFIDLIKEKPNCILGLATGSSPIITYQNLVKAYEKGEISFANVKTYNLDEYCGISRDNDQSYYYFMHDNLFNHVDIKEENVHVPYAKEGKEEECCNEYSKELNSVTVDIQLLGIGANGHVGFNEPNTPFSSETSIVTLTKKTREDNKRFFNSIDEVPTKAISMGIKNILNAKEIILIATGKNKADAIKKLMSGEITEEFPASALNLHNNVIIIVDEEAASLL